MKRETVFGFFFLGVTSCAAWTKQDTQTAETVAIDIACAIEHAELDDPALNAACDSQTAKAGHVRPTAATTRRTAHRDACAPDAGAEAGK